MRTTTSWLARGACLALLVAGVAGCGDDSSSPTPTKPAEPANMITTPMSYSTIALAWTDQSSDESGFKVYRGAMSYNVTTLIATTGADVVTYTDTGLVDTTTYHYRVHSFNDVGSSDAFASASATTFFKRPYSEIQTFMGTGTAYLGADGLPPLQTPLYQPQDLTFGPGDQPYVLDWNNHRVRTVEGGVVRTVVGTGELGDAPAGRADSIRVNHPTHVSFDPQGRLILSAWHNSKVMRVDLNTLQCVPIVGDGRRAFGGDGGLADTALVDLPVATAFDGMGRMYVADQANQVIRRVGLDGIINTIIGTPKMPGFAGDGGPANEAKLFLPVGQAAAPGGRIEFDGADNLYIADTSNNRIRKVDPSGIITTVAGTGPAGYSGDGGPATSARLFAPTDVALDKSDNLYIADWRNNCVRRVDAVTGIITTFAGVGQEPGYAGDGGHPAEAKLNRPSGLAFDAAENLYICDEYNYRVRVVLK